ncbi:hypothetical protein AR679_gp172 [Yellowstone lake phycodnavirus 1]|uniref:hypothetical protein n=1 Tax=Yellowstone lake phycodnavirus 1 TaxID=1586713 RepID=UPI0006EB9D61|nr:hypothetical protein AR679_gp172 [Yellowstone lake phycodnavirus 1]BAT22198.1 hypothetical protein [Yellowstone lake phycodnavirus 1]
MCDSIGNGCGGDGAVNVNISQTIPPYIYISNGNTINTFSAIYAPNIYANTITGTLLTPSQPYITSLGTLSYLNVWTYANASNFYGTISTPDQSLITNVGTLSNLTVAGTTTSGFFSGDGGGLTNVTFSTITGFSPNTLSNLNASNLAFGIVNSALIQGNTISNIAFANVSDFNPNTLSKPERV